MLYFVFTVDGDWDEYFNLKLSDEERKPKKEVLLKLIDGEIELTSKLLNGRFVHFVHSSPRVRETFLQNEYIAKWKEIEEKGGSVGVHCHEDDPKKAYYFEKPGRMGGAITLLSEALRKAGLNPRSFRGGYMGFSFETIPFLEMNKLELDLSCEPNRYLFHNGYILVSDWRGAPTNFYRLDYNDHRKAGNSNVYEIPLGTYKEKKLYSERFSLFDMWKVARALKKRSKNETVIVSVMAHTYDFGYPKMLRKLKLCLMMLKLFGKFINIDETLDIIRQTKKI